MGFRVEKELFEKLPDACFGVVVADGIDNTRDYPEIEKLLDEGIAAAEERFKGIRVKEDPDILPYREAFRRLGINPNKYLCSIEALFTRIAKGKGMPRINPIVDLGNAVSLKNTLPIGAHDIGRSTDDICVRLSRPDDTFLPFGSTEEEHPDEGEIVYAVGSQVRTRRWTWRQSEHGKIELATSRVFFPIDGFSDFNGENVLKARDELASKVEEVFGCTALRGFVDIDHPDMEF
ncbi:MAG: B3/4 domain-containing protein [Oscillospiraceae bacterium]